MRMYKKLAKAISYDRKRRKRKNVYYIVIHYTANKKDTAKNNADYFAHRNKREAGAHFFVDKLGNIAKSVTLDRVAWSVGGSKYSNCKETGGGSYYCKCTNYNSVSIELCDCTATEPYSKAQALAVKKLIKYIRRYCHNAKTVIRHFDVTGKSCPEPMVNEKVWKKFKIAIGEK